MIIEKIFPINYYNELSGLMTDSSLVQILLKRNFPQVFDFLEKCGGMLYLNNAINKWLLSIFLQGISDTYINFIWDLFLLEGNIIIFKSLYALMIILKPHILKCKSSEELNYVFTILPGKLKNRGRLGYYLIAKKFNFNMEKIKLFRRKLQGNVIKEIVKIGDFIREEENKKNKEIKCDLDWPLCMKNQKHFEKEYDHIILKQLNEPEVIEDYIDNYDNYQNNNKNMINEENFENILIERKMHFCGSQIRSIRDKIDKIDINEHNVINKEYDNKKKILYKIENEVEINKIVLNIANENQKDINFVKEKEEESVISYE